MLVLCLWVRSQCWCHFVRACWKFLLWYKRGRVYTKVCDQITNLSMAVAYLICDQVEAAFLMSFASTQGMMFFVFFFVFVLYLTDKRIYVCVCIVKCQDDWGKYLSWWLHLLSKRVKWSDDWRNWVPSILESTCNRLNLFHFHNALKIF